MATSMLLLRALIRRQAHPQCHASSISAAACSSRCLAGSVKSPWAATSPLSKKLTSFAYRPFSSKPVGVDVTMELENATNQDRVGTNPSNKLVSNMYASDEDVGMKIVEAPDGNAWIEFNEVGPLLQYSLSQICPFFFTYYKMVGESLVGRPISKAVILVPSYFNDAQRHATKEAATVAGFDIHKVITRESLEDAVSYGIEGNCPVAVLDLSGGTIDFNVWQPPNTDQLLKLIVSELQGHEYDVTKDPSALQRLKEAVERAWAKNTSGIIKIHMPVAAGEPEKSLELKWARE